MTCLLLTIPYLLLTCATATVWFLSFKNCHSLALNLFQVASLPGLNSSASRNSLHTTVPFHELLLMVEVQEILTNSSKSQNTHFGLQLPELFWRWWHDKFTLFLITPPSCSLLPFHLKFYYDFSYHFTAFFTDILTSAQTSRVHPLPFIGFP